MFIRNRPHLALLTMATLLGGLTLACDTKPIIALESPTGEGEGEEGEGEGEVVTLDDVVAAWDDIACDLYACAERTRVTDAVCAKAAAATGNPFGVIRFAADNVAAGTGTVDDAAVLACFNLLATIAVDDDAKADACFGPAAEGFAEAYGEDFNATCGQLFTGTIAAGEACSTDIQCAEGNSCLVADPFAFESCERTCRPILAVGEDCSGENRGDCDKGSFCDGSVCVARQLTPTGSQCFDHTACASGRCFDFTCVEKSAFNGECLQEGDCQFGQFCRPLPASTGLAGICQDPSAPDEECGFAVECAGNQSCAGYQQRQSGGNVNGTCRATPSDVGESCVPVGDEFAFGDTGCFADLRCDPSTSVCAEAPAVGEACAVDVPGSCGFEAWCNAGTCEAQVQPGEAATDAAACAVYGFIEGDVCVAFGRFSGEDRQRCPAPF